MKKKNLFFLSLILSVFIHLTFTVFLYVQEYFVSTPAPQNYVEVDLQNTQKMQTEEKKQVVDQNEEAINQEIDPKAKYLSKNNQKVIRQTVVKNHGEFQNQKNKNSAQGAPSADRFKKFLPSFDVVESVNEIQKRQKEQQKVLAQDTKPAGAQGGEVSQTLDYIKDLDPGLETLLSTKEFKYYTFYNRIRSQLNQYWTPKVREKVNQLFQEGRSIASTSDRITKCLVTLNKAGQLIKIQIIGQSGVQDLDEAAVEAFRAAAPFPNPPTGMVDEDGTIKIRWDFILEA